MIDKYTLLCSIYQDQPACDESGRFLKEKHSRPLKDGEPTEGGMKIYEES